MAWFRHESGLSGHRKTRKLASLLGVPRYAAAGLVCCLFERVCNDSPDGDISDWDDDDIADAARWDGDARPLVDALISVRFIIANDGKTEINSWMEYAGSYREAKRKQKYRKKKSEKEECPGTVPSQSHHSGRNVPSTYVRTYGQTDGRTDEQNNSELFPSEIKKTEKSPPKKKSLKKPDATDVIVGQVVDYYRSVHPNKGKPLVGPKARSHKDWKRIRERVDEGYTLDQLKAAIDGNRMDKWHQENSAGFTIEFIFRNATKVEQFIELRDRGGMTPAEAVYYSDDPFADTDHFLNRNREIVEAKLSSADDTALSLPKVSQG